jgi:hypothetical protein
MLHDGRDQGPRVRWPEGKRFPFTIFDDRDSQTLESGRRVYALLAGLGFRITKGVWPIHDSGTPSDHGGTCAEPEYRSWVRDLQAQGFEVGNHNATAHTSTREEALRGLDAFEPVKFCERLSGTSQDRLEEEGRACIMYTHLSGFVDRGRLDERFVTLMRRLRARNGWFVPVSTVLDHLLAQRPNPVPTDRQRRQIERRWLYHKARFGSS